MHPDRHSIPARLYHPDGLAAGSPLLVFHHGGGWVTGSLSSHDAVCRYLGLTPAEGDVVLALARGLSLADIARDRHVSLETVRTHVKRSLAKADVRRQSDLVRLVLTGPSGMGLRR